MASIFQHAGVRWISFSWTFFIAENLVLSHPPIRSFIIESFDAPHGEDNYHNLYNLCSTLACCSIGYGYYLHGRRQGPMITAGITPARIFLGFMLQSSGLSLISQLIPSIQSPVTVETSLNSSKHSDSLKGGSDQDRFKVRCPMDFNNRNPSSSDRDNAYGVERITRHASFWGLGLFCLGSAGTTRYVTHIAMNSFPVILAVVGGAHQDYKHRRILTPSGDPVLTQIKDDKTSHVPFVALLMGKQQFGDIMSECKLSNLGLAVGTAALLALRKLRA